MAKPQRFMGHADSRATQRYYDHLEVDDLEDALDLVPDLASATVVIPGSKLAVPFGRGLRVGGRGDLSAD